MDVSKFHGIFPAFYACYGEDGEISAERTRTFQGICSARECRVFMWADLPVSVFIIVWRSGKRRWRMSWRK